MFTQLALVLLLWGTMCGGLALISDVAVILTDRVAAAQEGVVLPGWVNGRTCMTAVALLVLFPLCLRRHMREVRAVDTHFSVIPDNFITLLVCNLLDALPVSTHSCRCLVGSMLAPAAQGGCHS